MYVFLRFFVVKSAKFQMSNDCPLSTTDISSIMANALTLTVCKNEGALVQLKSAFSEDTEAASAEYDQWSMHRRIIAAALVTSSLAIAGVIALRFRK